MLRTFRFILHFSVKCKDSQSTIRSTRGLAKFAEVFKVEAVSWFSTLLFVVPFFVLEDSGRVLLPAESGATDSRSLEPQMASCQWRNDKKRILFR